jgi:Transposase DDE domain
VDLCLSLLLADYRQTKGTIKLHVLLDYEGYLPDFVVITEGKTADVIVAHNFTLPAGSIVAVDRGYYDLTSLPSGINLVSFLLLILKVMPLNEVAKYCLLPHHSNALTDQLIQFTGYQSRPKFSGLLRRVLIWDEDNQREIELLTNHLRFGATTIGRIYRDRWEIELFFKMLKQNLEIKTFVGTTPDVLKTQIWTALIAVLLLKYLQFRSKCNLPLCRLVALLRLNLFSYLTYGTGLIILRYSPATKSLLIV